MTRDEFNRAMMPLSVLRGKPDDMDPFWEVFQHADAESFRRGCRHALKTRTFFPVPAELFADCEMTAPRLAWETAPAPPSSDAIRTEHLANPFGGKGITITVQRDWKYYCEDCSDSGQRALWCGESGPTRKPWHGGAFCGRTHDHAGHEWVNRCACWAGNPSLIRSRERLAQAASSRTQTRERAS